MANSKINTEETILRTPTDTPANADANSVRVYTNGTHVFSKDSAGNEVNLSTGSGSGAFDPTADTIVLGNNTGAGSNSIHLLSGGSGTDTITIGSGSSGETTASSMTEKVTVHSNAETEIHSLTEVNIDAPTTNIDSSTEVNIDSPTVNIDGDTVTIGNNTGAGANSIHLLSGGSGADTITIGSGASGETSSGSMTEKVTVHSSTETEVHSLTEINVAAPTVNIDGDTVTIGNNTGTGSNSVHLLSGGSGTDAITIGSGASRGNLFWLYDRKGHCSLLALKQKFIH